MVLLIPHHAHLATAAIVSFAHTPYGLGPPRYGIIVWACVATGRLVNPFAKSNAYGNLTSGVVEVLDFKTSEDAYGIIVYFPFSAESYVIHSNLPHPCHISQD